MRLHTSSPEQTAAAGEALGRVATPGLVIGLSGDLGAGKTLFVQGLARGLGVPSTVRVVSPTFTLLNEYRGGRLLLHHADLYRLERADELDEIGLDEVMRGDGVVAIEWADRFDVLPPDALAIRLGVVADRERSIEAADSDLVRAAWAAG